MNQRGTVKSQKEIWLFQVSSELRISKSNVSDTVYLSELRYEGTHGLHNQNISLPRKQVFLPPAKTQKILTVKIYSSCKSPENSFLGANCHFVKDFFVGETFILMYQTYFKERQE